MIHIAQYRGPVVVARWLAEQAPVEAYGLESVERQFQKIGSINSAFRRLPVFRASPFPAWPITRRSAQDFIAMVDKAARSTAKRDMRNCC
jgi:hypothetical protein